METKFLGLIIDNTLSWKQHIERVVNKMCTACLALRNVKHTVALDTLRLIYFTHIHTMMICGIIFWGSSYYSNKVFILQKRIIRVMTNVRPKDSCMETFKSMEITTFYSQYIYSLFLYIVNNKHQFITIYIFQRDTQCSCTD